MVMHSLKWASSRWTVTSSSHLGGQRWDSCWSQSLDACCLLSLGQCCYQWMDSHSLSWGMRTRGSHFLILRPSRGKKSLFCPSKTAWESNSAGLFLCGSSSDNYSFGDPSCWASIEHCFSSQFHLFWSFARFSQTYWFRLTLLTSSHSIPTL